MKRRESPGGSRPGRHRDAIDVPRWARVWERIRPGVDRPLYSAVLAGLAFGTIIGISAAHDVSTTRGWPAERATVVTIEDQGGFFSGCGRGEGRAKDITWRSKDAPPGLPVTFLDEGACLETSVGETWTVVRVVEWNGRVDVLVNPTRTYDDEAEETAIAAGLGFGVVFVALVARAWWVDRRSRGFLRG